MEDKAVRPRSKRPASTLVSSRSEYVAPVWEYYFNGQGLEMLQPLGGYSIEEWCAGGKAFYKHVFCPQSIDRMRMATQHIKAAGQPVYNLPVVLTGKHNAQHFHYLLNYQPLFDNDQRVIGMRAVARDITEILRMQQLFELAPELLADIFQVTTDFICMWYFDARAGFANHELAGYSARQWVTDGLALFSACLHPESERRFSRALDYLRVSGERIQHLELDLNGAEETRHRLRVNFLPLLNSAGEIIGVLGMVLDSSELTRIQAALRHSEMQFIDFFNNAHDLIFTLDTQGNLLYMNKAFKSLHGDAPALSRNYLDVIHPEYRAEEWQVLCEVFRGREVIGHTSVQVLANGAWRNVSVNLQPRLDAQWEVIGAIAMARDVTEQKRYEQQLEHLAEHDALTGLYNRHYFEIELARSIAVIARNDHAAGLLYIDLDNFKYVNDTLGHSSGDKLLLDVAHLLSERMREGDVLARFGGDEFTVLLANMNPEELLNVAKSFQKQFRGFTFVHQERIFDIRVSVGAVLIDKQIPTASDALSRADLACTLAKSRGRNQVHLYNPEDQQLASMVSDVSWTRKINRALEEDLFVLHYQPIVRIRDGAITHYEVLVRLLEDDGRLTTPGMFLPAAERFGLMHAIDRWVVEQAIAELARQHAAGNRISLAINLSAKVFDDSGFLPFLSRACKSRQLDPSTLMFELTETAAIGQMASAQEFVKQLISLGIEVALDDFGSGFSSYGYLKNLPVSYLKIDGSFVKDLVSDPVDQAIVQSMHQVAHALGKQTIAEFVEDELILARLRDYGVDYAQGYYFGKPLPRFDSK